MISKSYSLLILLALSSCVSGSKTKIGSVNIHTNYNPARSQKILDLNLEGLNSFVYTNQTLDLFLYNPSTRTKINLKLDAVKSSSDSLFFNVEKIPVGFSNLRFSFYLTPDQYKNFILKSDDTEGRSFEFVYSRPENRKRDSLDFALSKIPGFKTKITDAKRLGDGAFKFYDGAISVGGKENLEFHASTDPIPILLIAVAAGIVWVIDHANNSKEADRSSKNLPCDEKCKLIAFNTKKPYCKCPPK